MKQFAKIALSLLLVAAITVVCGSTTACSSSKDTMYTTKKKTSKTINKNYKVRGNNTNNGSTYRTY